MALKIYGTREQREVICAQERFLGMFAGRRYGKTFTARNRIILKTATPGYQYWYVTPAYAQCIEEFDALAYHPDFRQYIAKTKLQPYPQIWLKNGSRIGYRAFADRPENLRSRGLNEVWVDEIQDIPEDSFWKVIRPLISDKRGTLIVSGQFRGKNWYYKQFFEKGQKRVANYNSWRLPSSLGICFQGPAGIAELVLAKSQVGSAVWEQEYECNPLSNQDRVFRDVDRCISGTRLDFPERNRSYIAAWDMGRVEDPSAFVILERETGIVVHAETFALGTEWTTQSSLVSEKCERFRVDACLIDVTGTNRDGLVDFIGEKIRRLQPFMFRAGNKKDVIERMVWELERKMVFVPECHAELIHQLNAFEYKQRATFTQYAAPQGEHDDLVHALAMAIWERAGRTGKAPGMLPLSAMGI